MRPRKASVRPGLSATSVTIAPLSPRATTPFSYAKTTACTRSRSRSFIRMCATWVFTVVSETNAASAISAFERPRAT